MSDRSCKYIAWLGYLWLSAAAIAQDAASPSILESIPSFLRSGEYLVEETYVSDAAVRRKNRTISDFDENDTILRYVATPRTKWGVLRLGLEFRAARRCRTVCRNSAPSSGSTCNSPTRSSFESKRSPDSTGRTILIPIKSTRLSSPGALIFIIQTFSSFSE